jgi:hypothetical protein
VVVIDRPLTPVPAGRIGAAYCAHPTLLVEQRLKLGVGDSVTAWHVKATSAFRPTWADELAGVFPLAAGAAPLQPVPLFGLVHLP